LTLGSSSSWQSSKDSQWRNWPLDEKKKLLEKLEQKASTLTMPSWKVPSALPEWLEKFFYIEDPVDLVTGDLLPPGPIRLLPHQRRILAAMTERDGNGRFRWTTLLYSTVKKVARPAWRRAQWPGWPHSLAPTRSAM